MRLNRRVKQALAIAAAGASLSLAACSHIQPSLGEWAITTGHGSFSNQDVIHVTGPGHRINIGSGTTTWYIPANTRNYVTTPEGSADAQPDRAQPASVLTSSGGQTDNGLSVHVYTFVNFEVNPAIQNPGPRHNYPLATAFLQACLKYGCATQHSINTDQESLRNGDPGWLQWVDEIFPRAIDNATRTVIDKAQYGPNIWLEQNKWGQVATDISSQLDEELAKLDGSAGVHAADFFCGVGSTTTKCLPMFVQIIPPGIQPVDQGVITAYRQKQQAQYALNASKARVELAKELYGKDYGWFLGMMDLVTKCQDQHVPCTIYAGNAPFHP